MADGTQIRITAVDQTTAAFRSVQGNIGALQNSLRGIAGPLAAAFSVAGLTAFAKSVIDTSDRLTDLSKQTGIAVDQLSSLGNAAKLNGTTADTLNTGLVKLNRAISEATSGSEEQLKAFSALGISQEELRKSSPVEVFYRIADAFAGAADGAGKTDVAMKLLGRSGAELIPMLNEGSNALKKFEATVTAEQAKQFAEFNDNIDKLVISLQKMAVTVLGPVISGVNSFFASLEKGKQKIADTKGTVGTFDMFLEDFAEKASIATQEAKSLVNEINNIDKQPKKQIIVPEDIKNLKISTQTQKEFADELKKLEKIFQATDPAARKYYESLKELQEISYMLFPDEILDRQMAIEEEFANSQKTVRAAKSALQDYADTMLNLADNVQLAAIRSLGNLENSLVRVMMGTMTVKDAFRAMAISIIEDLIRIQVRRQIVGPLASALDAALPFGRSTATTTASSLGSGITIPGRAMGGTVGVGKPYMVGENGPELFIPGQTGTVVPNGQLGGSGAVVNQTINISTGVSQTVRAEIVNMLPRIMESTKAAIADSRRRGGGFAKMMGT